jgi:hypothetical protein
MIAVGINLLPAIFAAVGFAAANRPCSLNGSGGNHISFVLGKKII